VIGFGWVVCISLGDVSGSAQQLIEHNAGRQAPDPW
jgi:hypothetical protein